MRQPARDQQERRDQQEKRDQRQHGARAGTHAAHLVDLGVQARKEDILMLLRCYAILERLQVFFEELVVDILVRPRRKRNRADVLAKLHRVEMRAAHRPCEPRSPPSGKPGTFATGVALSSPSNLHEPSISALLSSKP